jgi:hypothetical protein
MSQERDQSGGKIAFDHFADGGPAQAGHEMQRGWETDAENVISTVTSTNN